LSCLVYDHSLFELPFDQPPRPVLLGLYRAVELPFDQPPRPVLLGLCRAANLRCAVTVRVKAGIGGERR
jgi:hypothetical protein